MLEFKVRFVTCKGAPGCEKSKALSHADAMPRAQSSLVLAADGYIHLTSSLSLFVSVLLPDGPVCLNSFACTML